MSITDILKFAYGPKGLPFPRPAEKPGGNPIAGEFAGSMPGQPTDRSSITGKALYEQNALGRWVFLPASLNGQPLPNPLVSINGEKSIIETDVTEVGTVFEKAFTRPYDITIICTLLNGDNSWPEAEIKRMEQLYTQGDLYTLACPLTDLFLQPQNNFLLKGISVIDMGVCDNAQVIQLNGRSNIDFELVILE